MQYEQLGVNSRSFIKSHTSFYNRMNAVCDKINQYNKMINPSNVKPRQMKMFGVRPTTASTLLSPANAAKRTPKAQASHMLTYLNSGGRDKAKLQQMLREVSQNPQTNRSAEKSADKSFHSSHANLECEATLEQRRPAGLFVHTGSRRPQTAGCKDFLKMNKKSLQGSPRKLPDDGNTPTSAAFRLNVSMAAQPLTSHTSNANRMTQATFSKHNPEHTFKTIQCHPANSQDTAVWRSICSRNESLFSGDKRSKAPLRCQESMTSKEVTSEDH